MTSLRKGFPTPGGAPEPAVSSSTPAPLIGKRISPSKTGPGTGCNHPGTAFRGITARRAPQNRAACGGAFQRPSVLPRPPAWSSGYIRETSPRCRPAARAPMDRSLLPGTAPGALCCDQAHARPVPRNRARGRSGRFSLSSSPVPAGSTRRAGLRVHRHPSTSFTRIS